MMATWCEQCRTKELGAHFAVEGSDKGPVLLNLTTATPYFHRVAFSLNLVLPRVPSSLLVRAVLMGQPKHLLDHFALALD